VENTTPRLWYHEMRRRVMVNLWLWDRQGTPLFLLTLKIKLTI
jgi:hypothetical protein